MSYRIFILRRAQKELSKLPAGAFERVKESIRRLSEDPLPHGFRTRR